MYFQPPESDYLVFDFLAPISFWPRQPDNSLPYRYVVPDCLRVTRDKEYQVMLGFEAGLQMMTFQVWKRGLERAQAFSPAVLPPLAPKCKDVLTDENGLNWIIQRVYPSSEPTLRCLVACFPKRRALPCQDAAGAMLRKSNIGGVCWRSGGGAG
jgi:hypothetical protein